MPKLPYSLSKKTFFVSGLTILILTVIVFTLFPKPKDIKCFINNLYCRIDEEYRPLPEPPPISYNSNCRIPTVSDTKREIRASMIAIYSCAVQNTLSKYKDRSITLESPKTQTNLVNSLFGSSKIQTNLMVYDSGNWQIFFWSPKAEQKFQTENYQIHLDSHIHRDEDLDTGASMIALKTKAGAPTAEMVMSQPELVIKVKDGFETLNYKHILKITGFNTETQMIDFVLLHSKLLGQKQKLFDRGVDQPLDSAIRKSIPLLFLQDYQFSNKADQGLKFSCSEEFSSNLKTQINLDQKEIQYFAHQNQYSLSKITLKLEADTLEYKIENLLNCGSMIIC